MRREKVCSQPHSQGRDASLIGKSLDNEDINSCPTAELPLKVKGLAAFPEDKLQVSNAELKVRRGGLDLGVRASGLHHFSREPQKASLMSLDSRLQVAPLSLWPSPPMGRGPGPFEVSVSLSVKKGAGSEGFQGLSVIGASE